MSEFEEINEQDTELTEIVRALDSEEEIASDTVNAAQGESAPAKEAAHIEVVAEQPAQTEQQPEADTELTIAPEPVVALAPGRVTTWPFLAHAALWAIFAGLLAWQLLGVDRVTPVSETAFYGQAVWAGVALTALAPIVILVAWLVSRKDGVDRRGLFTQAMAFGALSALFGVVVWWGVLIAADYARFGTWF